MTFKEIQELIGLINKSNLTEFKMQQGDLKLVIRTAKYTKGKQYVTAAPAPLTQGQSVPYPAPAAQGMAPSTPSRAENMVPDLAPVPPKATEIAVATGYLEIRSPIVGTFYRSASPEKGPLVKVGDAINKGTVVCLIEAMKLFNEIESEVKGKIVKVVADDASPVEYDQVLFLVDPNN